MVTLLPVIEQGFMALSMKQWSLLAKISETAVSASTYNYEGKYTSI